MSFKLFLRIIYFMVIENETFKISEDSQVFYKTVNIIAKITWLF